MAEGLTYGLPSAMGGAAGLNEPQTMGDQAAMKARLSYEGVPEEDAARAAGVDNTVPPSEAATYFEQVKPATQSILANAARGVGNLISDATGFEAPEALGDAAFDALKPSFEDQAKIDERAYERQRKLEAGEITKPQAVAGQIFDGVPTALPYMGVAIGGGVGTRKITDLALAGVERFGRSIPGRGKIAAAAQWAGGFGILTAIEQSFGQERLAEQGIDIDKDPEANALNRKQALVKGALNTLPILRFFGIKGAADMPRTGGVVKRFLTGGAKTAPLEAIQEMTDVAVEETFLNPALRKEIAERGWSAWPGYVAENLGDDLVVAAGTGALVGGAVGAGGDAYAQKVANTRLAKDVKVASETLEPLGLGTPELEGLAASGDGAKRLSDGVARLGRIDRARKTNLKLVDEQAAAGIVNEDEARQWKQNINDELDKGVDEVAKTLGAPKTIADVRRERTAWEKERQRTAAERLAQRGLKPQKDLSPDVAEEVAGRIERADGEVDRLRNRLDATANAERRAETQAELDEAMVEQRQARVDGRMRAEGLTSAQALKAVEQEGRKTEAEKRLEAQRGARERAVERQTEIEMPETMVPAARAKRAQEIIAEAEATARPDAGLDGKIKRLERQRRAATSPEDVDRLTDEIADLEARRGLPTPAVEAARRVLQAQGLAVPQRGEASGPTAQPAVSEGLQPEDAASGPVGAAAPAGPRKPKARPPEDEELVITLRDKPAKPVVATDKSRAARARRLYDSSISRGMTPDAAAARAVDLTAESGDGKVRGFLGKLTRPSREQVTMVLDALEDQQTLIRPNGTIIDAYPYTDLTSTLRSVPDLPALYEMLADISSADYAEVSALITPDGKVISAGTNGHPHSVIVMSPKDAAPGDYIDIHTHPANLPFSMTDAYATMMTRQTSRVVLPDGQVLEMRPLVPPGKLVEEAFDVLIDLATEARNMTPTRGADPFYNLATHQEAVLQAAEIMGLIDYSVPFQGLGQNQKDTINDILDAFKPRLDAVAAKVARGPRLYGGSGSPQVRSSGRSPGLRRAFDASGSESESEAGDTFTDEIDALIGDGTDFRHAARRDRKPSVDKVKLRELSEKVHAELLTRATASNHKKSALLTAIRDGEVTVDQVEAGIKAWVENDGYKRMHALTHVARVMFPDAKLGPDDIEHVVRTKRGRSDFGKKYWRIKPEATKHYRMAFELAEKVRLGGQGHIDKRTISLDSKAGLPFKTGFVVVEDRLKDFLGFTSPEHTRFDKPHPADDTTYLKRDERGNLFSDDALVPGRRTARYLQANRYTLDADKIARLTPKDMLSSKGLAADGLKMADVDRYIALQRVPQGDLSKEEQVFLKDHGKDINERLDIGANKLRQLRRAYKEFVAENGPDAETGFMYQVDNRGRIYADGQFNPQGGSAIKAIFRHKGVSLADMTEVDASASGWQVTAIMSRDHIAAPNINLGRGQATAGGGKSDLYTNTINKTLDKLRADAAVDVSALPLKERAEASRKKRVAERFLAVGVRPDGKLNRDAVKGSVIAINYGGNKSNFMQNLTNVFMADKAELGFTEGDRPWGYLAETTYNSLVESAPHSMALQNWAIGSIEKLVVAMNAKYPAGTAPPIVLSVGLEGAVSVKKKKTRLAEAEIDNRTVGQYARGQGGYQLDDNGERILLGNAGEDQVTVKTEVDLREIDAKAVARAAWANIVQGFDASILHRAVERYKQLTNGAYITTNHDSFTVPPEHEGAVAASVRESMLEIMSQVDVPQRIYEEVTRMAAQHGVEIDVQPFNSMGQYNMDDLMTSTPVFGEGAKGKNYIPDYAEIPEDAPTLRRAVDPEVPAGGAGAAAVGMSPVRGPVRGQGASTTSDLTPTLRRAVDVANYMEQFDEPSTTLTAMQDYALDPKAETERHLQTLERSTTNVFQPIRSLEKRVRGDGTIGVGMESAFKAAEMATNDTGRTEAILYYGAGAFGPRMEFQTAPGTVGLKEIFRTASGGKRDGQKLQHWIEYMAALRAKELNARGIKTPQTAKDIQTALARANPDFVAAQKMWQAHNRANLKMLLDSGRISKPQHDAMARDDFYIPFYRSEENVNGSSPELDLGGYAMTAAGGLRDRDPGIMAIKGGDKKRIGNLVNNMIRNSQAMVAASMRNMAANKVFDLMDTAGLIKVVPASQPKPNNNAIKRWKNGKEEWVVPLDDDAVMVIGALGGLQPIQIDGMLNIFNNVSRMYSAATTTKPRFIMTNLWRGMVQNGILTKGANLTLSNNTITGALKALGILNQDAYKDFKQISGMGDYRRGQLPTTWGQNDILVDVGLSSRSVGSVGRKLFGVWESVGMASEMADRIAAYETMVSRGTPKDEAAYQALSVMNYNRRGGSPTVRTWISTMPFMNARLQGYTRLTEGAVGWDGKPATRADAFKKMALMGMLYTAANAMIWGWNYGDEERRDIYQSLPTWRRTMFANIVLPNGFILTLPQPFELGFVFGSVPTAILDSNAETISASPLMQALGVEPGAEGIDNAWWQVGSKILADIMAFGLLPQAIAPFIEGKMNTDLFFERPIENRAEQGMFSELRVTGADELGKTIGSRLGLSRALRESPFGIDLSPAMITHYGSNFGGVPWVFMAGLMNTFAPDVGAAPPRVENVFGSSFAAQFANSSLAGFVFDPTITRNRWSEEFYNAGRQVQQHAASFKEVMGQDYVEGAPEAMAKAKFYNSMQDELSDLRKWRTSVLEDMNMDPAEKRRQLQQITKTENGLLEAGARGLQTELTPQ